MYKGTKTFDLKGHNQHRVTLRTTGPFTLVEIDADGEVINILGPENSEGRFLRVVPSLKAAAVQVLCGDSTSYVYLDENLPSRKEVPDPIPVEVPYDMTRPPTMEELIRMHVRQAMADHSDDLGTFEEEDDFDIDEEDLPYSQYEMRDMVEEELTGYPVEPTSPPAEQTGESLAKQGAAEAPAAASEPAPN